jgi:6-phosphofructokinase 1
MKIGILTGGGDCPGLNAVIRAVVRKGSFHYSDTFVGFLEGWRGLLENMTMPLDLGAVAGILPRGGTILRTSRTNPAKKPDGLDKCLATLKQHGLDALVAIGGDDTLSVATKLYDRGVKVVGVPKTIDNDLSGTDFTFGFDTAVNIVTEAIDRVHTTAEAHNRVMVVEVMGRDAGWIAIYSGIAGGADVILIPEIPYKLARIAAKIEDLKKEGRNFALVVVAEAVQTEDGQPLLTQHAGGQATYGGIGHYISERIAELTGAETRVTVLGHVQRGGSPEPGDRVIASAFGVHAVDLIAMGRFDRMVAWQNRRVVDVPIAEAIAHYQAVDAGGTLVVTARGLGISFGD